MSDRLTDETLRKMIDLLDSAKIPEEDRSIYFIVPKDLPDDKIHEYLLKALEREGITPIRDCPLPTAREPYPVPAVRRSRRR